MRRIWWLLALLVVVGALASYHWRDQLTGLVGGARAVAASAPPATGPSPRASPQAQGAAVGNGGAPAGGRPGGAGRGAGAGGAAGPGNGQAAFTVATVAATAGELPQQRQTIGWIVAESTTNLTSAIAGTVSEVDAMPGSDVKKGDVLLKLDARTANAALAKDKAGLQRDQATLDQATRAKTTAETLAQRGADTETAAQQAETAEAVAQATIAVDNAQIAADQVALDNTVIRAPYDGRIGGFQVAVGSLVQPGGQVVTLTQMAPVDVQFSVAESDLAMLRSAVAAGGAQVTAKPAGVSEGATGKVTFIDSSVDRASGTVQARGELDNADRSLWPGQSVGVSLDLGGKGGLVLVPTVAVVPQSSGSVVYVVKPDKTIDVRKVTIAGTSGDMTGLSTGIQAGEHIVVEGQFNLVAGQRVAETQAATAASVKTG